MTMTALLFWTYTLLNLFCKYFYFQITLHACFEEKEFQLTNSRERERERSPMSICCDSVLEVRWLRARYRFIRQQGR